MKLILPILSLASAAALCSTAAQAQTVTGTIDATITLVSGCQVNGNTAATAVDFGTIDFGSHTTLFDEALTQLEANGDASISILCSPGSPASLTVTSGLHDGVVAGASRAMANGSNFVPYDIYSDSARNNLLANNTSISVPADGTVQEVPIYARAEGRPGLVAGIYTDTLSVTLTF